MKCMYITKEMKSNLNSPAVKKCENAVVKKMCGGQEVAVMVG